MEVALSLSMGELICVCGHLQRKTKARSKVVIAACCCLDPRPRPRSLNCYLVMSAIMWVGMRIYS